MDPYDEIRWLPSQEIGWLPSVKFCTVRADHPEDTEKVLGKPCYIYRGNVLAWEKDPAHIKVFAWATVNLFPGKPLAWTSTARPGFWDCLPERFKIRWPGW